MNLRVVAGRDVEVVEEGAPGAGPADVWREARRRLARAGHDRYHVRHQVTGAAIPRDIAYFAMQVEFVANTLLTIVPIPEDYRKDHYWPRLPERG